jgi:DNA (cytosine-5)-methyltransferase 1
MGLHKAGFEVVGVVVNPQPRYPFEFHQADATTFPTVGFDFIWASPPCQQFTALRHLHRKEYPNLIPAIRARLIASGIPYVIENVEGAPLGGHHLIMLCGTMFALRTADGRAELRRHRIFETSFSIPLRPECQHGYVPSLSVCGKGGHFTAPKVLTVCGHTPVDNRRPSTLTVTGTGLDDNKMRRARAISITGATPQTNVVRNVVREVFTVQQAREAMGIDWMSMKGLSQAIPPAYSQFIAESFLASITSRGDGR